MLWYWNGMLMLWYWNGMLMLWYCIEVKFCYMFCNGNTLEWYWIACLYYGIDMACLCCNIEMACLLYGIGISCSCMLLGDMIMVPMYVGKMGCLLDAYSIKKHAYSNDYKIIKYNRCMTLLFANYVNSWEVRSILGQMGSWYFRKLKLWFSYFIFVQRTAYSRIYITSYAV